MDHEDFVGAFTLPCTPAAVVVHRMNATRWTRFVPEECHVCGPAHDPFDSDPDMAPVERGPLSFDSTAWMPSVAKCISPHEIACIWPRESRDFARRSGVQGCLGLCRGEARVNGTR